MLNITFFITSIMLGIGLAVDSFLISLSNGLTTQKGKKIKTLISAITFALFQFSAVLLGYICVNTLKTRFLFIEDVLSYIASLLLLIIGTKLVANGVKNNTYNFKSHNTMQQNLPNPQPNLLQKMQSTQQNLPQNLQNPKSNLPQNLQKSQQSSTQNSKPKPWFLILIIQALLTSADAFSIGFIISNNPLNLALISASIISFITMLMYLTGFLLGKKFGTKLGPKAEILGGITFIIIAIEIFLTALLTN